MKFFLLVQARASKLIAKNKNLIFYKFSFKNSSLPRFFIITVLTVMPSNLSSPTILHFPSKQCAWGKLITIP